MKRLDSVYVVLVMTLGGLGCFVGPGSVCLSMFYGNDIGVSLKGHVR